MNTTKVLLMVALLYAGYAYSTPWPILGDVKIISCRDSSSGPCTVDVYYSTSGTVMVDVIPVGPPLWTHPYLDVVGVYCYGGNALTGDLPFKACQFSAGANHAPTLSGKCKVKRLDSWELTPDSDCTVLPTWGAHHGAGPGAQCVIFGFIDAGMIYTPWGWLTPEQAANGSNRFCVKAQPPSVTCNLSLPAEIQHGVLRPGETSKRIDDGTIDCGASPKVDVLVNGDGERGGVRITAVPAVVNQTQIRITSEVTVSPSAAGGDYSAMYVFVASPY